MKHCGGLTHTHRWRAADARPRRLVTRRLVCVWLSKTISSSIALASSRRGGGKVHGSLARAGKVKGQTPKVEKQETKKQPRGRAKKRMLRVTPRLALDWRFCHFVSHTRISRLFSSRRTRLAATTVVSSTLSPASAASAWAPTPTPRRWRNRFSGLVEVFCVRLLVDLISF